MKTTIIGGVLFLAPLAVVLILAAKLMQVSKELIAPLSKIIPVDKLYGAIALEALAIAVILLACYLAGLVALKTRFGKRLNRVDGFLTDVIPGYAVFKGTVSGVARHEDPEKLMTPVLVRFDDYEQIAFEIEAQDKASVVFLPGSPSAWSGSTIIVDRARVRPLGLRVHQTVKLLRVLGRGSLNARSHAPGHEPSET